MNKIFLVYENSDTTEGRGPMVIVKDSGFFLTEKEAWDFADTIPGVMGYKPQGSWRHEKYPHVEVRSFSKHDPEKEKKVKDLEQKISKLQKELQTLKG